MFSVEFIDPGRPAGAATPLVLAGADLWLGIEGAALRMVTVNDD